MLACVKFTVNITFYFFDFVEESIEKERFLTLAFDPLNHALPRRVTRDQNAINQESSNHFDTRERSPCF